MDREEAIRSQIEQGIALERWLQDEATLLIAIAEEMAEAFRRGNRVFLFGNGGSAADAEHIAAELAGRFRLERDPLPAVSLTANSSAVTAIANDYGYERVFVRQLQGLLTRGDVVVGISTSGNSPNVLAAMEEAKRRGAITVAFTGEAGRLAGMSDHVLSVPSSDTARVQELHITAGHIICHLVEEALFGSGGHE